LTSTVAQLSTRVDQLASRMDQLVDRVDRLVASQERLVDRVARLSGWELEERYRRYAPAYFGRRLRRPRPVDLNDLADALRERLTEEELGDVLLADLILSGRLPDRPGEAELWVVMEVSATVDRYDVERAQRRAALLRKAQYPALAVVGGEGLTAGARQVADEFRVALFVDGGLQGWQEALDQALV